MAPVAEDSLSMNSTSYGSKEVSFSNSIPAPVTISSTDAKIELTVPGDYIIQAEVFLRIDQNTAVYPVVDLLLNDDTLGGTLAGNSPEGRAVGAPLGTLSLRGSNTWHVRVTDTYQTKSLIPQVVVGKLNGISHTDPLLPLTETFTLNGTFTVDRFTTPTC